MKVYIRNKLISLGGSSKVLDENKEPLMNVKGKIFSITKKKFIYDKEGNLLYKVRNKWFKFINHAAFIYDAEGNKIATVKNSYWSLRGKYMVTDYSDEITIEGKFFNLTSTIYKNGEVMGTIRRDLSLANDYFTLEADEQDIPFLVALVIALDNISDRKQKEK